MHRDDLNTDHFSYMTHAVYNSIKPAPVKDGMHPVFSIFDIFS